MKPLKYQWEPPGHLKLEQCETVKQKKISSGNKCPSTSLIHVDSTSSQKFLISKIEGHASHSHQKKEKQHKRKYSAFRYSNLPSIHILYIDPSYFFPLSKLFFQPFYRFNQKSLETLASNSHIFRPRFVGRRSVARQPRMVP